MAITTTPPVNPGIPNSKTTVAENASGIPVAKTTVSGAAAAIPTSKTTVAESAAAIPTAKTTVSASAAGIPTSKTTVSASAAAIPTTKTTIGAAGIPRALTPLVDMHLDSQTFSQNGNSISFSDLFTYARSSNATFINRRVVNNKAEYFLDTDFVGSVTNLLTFSEQMDNAAYAKSNSTVTVNAAQSPISDTTADKLIEASDSASIHLLRRSESFTSGTDYTVSVFVKSNGRSQFAITTQAPAVTGGYRAIFDLNASAVISRSQSDLPASIWSVGDGWYLCSITFNADATNSAFVEFELAKNGTVTYDGDGSSGLFIWGAQMTASAKPEPYVKTTGSSDSLTFTESLRVEYDAATGENLGVSFEDGSTNLAVRSEAFENASWTKTRSSITENATKSPDGTLSADNLIEDGTASSTHQTTQSVSFTSGNVYTLSYFVKAKERTECFLQLGNAAFPASASAFFDLLLGTVGALGGGADSATIKSVGDGWFRCSVTATSDSSVSSTIELMTAVSGSTSYNGDSSSGIYVWGAQVEVGAIASSYIMTEGSTATRASEDLSIPSLGHYSNGDITLFLDLNMERPTGGTGSSRYFHGLDGANSTQSYGRLASAGNLQSRHGANAFTITDTIKESFKYAMAYDRSASSIDTYTDGVLREPNALTTAFSFDNTEAISIGASQSFTDSLNGHIKKFTIYNELLTPQEVALL